MEGIEIKWNPNSIGILDIKKDLIPQITQHGTPSEARTPDTLIKSQVLYQLS